MSEKIHIIPNRKTTFGDSCIHFKGLGLSGNVVPFEEQRCNAGVKYVDVSINGEWKYYQRNESTGRPYTQTRCMPCNRAYNFGGAKCDKAQFPTEQEVEEWLEESNRRAGMVDIARKAIIEHLKGGYGSGAIDCPVCKSGKLGFSRSSYNGHVHAKCSSDDCVVWME